MTSSQDPPLTRREARERERLRAERASQARPEPEIDPEHAAFAPPPQEPAATEEPADATSHPRVAEEDFAASTVSDSATDAGRGDDTAALDDSVPDSPGAPSPYAPSAPAGPIAHDRGLADDTEGGRTLTRRQPRDLRAAQAAGGETDDADGSDASNGGPDGDQEQAPVDDADAPTPTRPAPVGHWSTALTDDARSDEAGDDSAAEDPRRARGNPVSANALILPQVPPSDDRAELTSEILITGSLSDPPFYGIKNARSPHVDSADLDRLFEGQDDDASGESSPVSATNAISTQTSSSTVVEPPTKERMNVPLVLAATAGVIALGVVGVLVGGYVLNIF